MFEATCTTTGGPADSPYSFQANFNPTDATAGGFFPSSSEPIKGQVAPGPSQGEAGSATTNGPIASVPVTCDSPSGSPCAVTVRLSVLETLRGNKVVAVAAGVKNRTARSTKRAVAVGARTMTLDAGQTRDIVVALNRAGTALLKSHAILAVKLTASLGGSPFASQTVTFAKHKRKRG
jgi:hypothetical protein